MTKQKEEPQKKVKEKKPFFAEQKTIRRPSMKVRRWPWIVGGILLILLITAVGAWAGYQRGVNIRIDKQQGEIAMIAAQQYQLGVQDQADGRYQMAKKRFEYVIQIDPNFPGASEKLAEVMVAEAMNNNSASVPVMPTVEPSPTVEPTPDMRGAEEIYNSAISMLNNKNWNGTIQTLDNLRKYNREYRAVEVDGMYYTALRHRGLDKILVEGNLEGGIYDLALAERFGPLDSEAANYRNWARYYLTGASFWEIDWLQVINYFAEVYPSLPNLRDGSGWTAQERYRFASLRYAEQLIWAEEWCEAEQYLINALSFGSDPMVEPTATHVASQCRPPESTEEASE